MGLDCGNYKSSILATDFSSLKERNELWIEGRLKKENIYQAFSEYIEFLENMLNYEQDVYQRNLIEKEIQNLKKEQENYYVPSILEMAKFEFTDNHDEFKNSLEKSSFSLVKRVKNDFNKR